MRQLLVLSFIANVLLSLYAWIESPEQVATHFGADGRPDDWMSRTVNAVVMLGVNGLIFVLFYFMPQALRVTPARWFSLPHKDYWLQPENRPGFEATFTWLMDLFGAVTLVFMFVVGWLALRANLADPVRLAAGPFWIAFLVYMVFTVVWVVWLFRALRVPEAGARR